ncbi:possible pyrimidine nucleoside phosphorylase [Weissella oryzae SG25]|uniref:Possible pyrimidine nucleoside phosphorylase n=1 Tax=Weissella oryzae (strain DSM 25784 / JCM 18191 / LMG 30913 / SG25) TaxID=1329250 RepID=A0A069CT03_WEIOS|nr:nucleoside hydrolase [Weissella oryzae]GAK30945.1 possible pyrimidine nucleoside phosphorylase [Weissella oryzae SG25]
MAVKKMILDLDTGVDDALALAYALATPDADLIGIVSSYGNTLVDTAAENSLKLLELLDASDVPVFLGESHSSTTDDFATMEISMAIHGRNGIGEVELPKAARPVEAKHAVDFIIEAAHEYGEDLIIVPTGPLTNLALAMQKDPSIADLIGNITLMGGALVVPGNVTAYTEANINQDPQAADYVFKHAKHLVMVGLDVTLQTLLTKKETQVWRDLGSKKGQIFADIFDYYIDAYDRLDINHDGAALHDPLAVGVAVDPKLVTLLGINMQVTHEDGRTIGDPERLRDTHKTNFAAVEVDVPGYLERFMNYMNIVLSD